jgi:hypothetical protein
MWLSCMVQRKGKALFYHCTATVSHFGLSQGGPFTLHVTCHDMTGPLLCTWPVTIWQALYSARDLSRWQALYSARDLSRYDRPFTLHVTCHGMTGPLLCTWPLTIWEALYSALDLSRWQALYSARDLSRWQTLYSALDLSRCNRPFTLHLTCHDMTGPLLCTWPVTICPPPVINADHETNWKLRGHWWLETASYLLQQPKVAGLRKMGVRCSTVAELPEPLSLNSQTGTFVLLFSYRKCSDAQTFETSPCLHTPSGTAQLKGTGTCYTAQLNTKGSS